MNEYDNDKSWDKSQEEKNFDVEQKKKKPRHRSTTTSDFLIYFLSSQLYKLYNKTSHVPYMSPISPVFNTVESVRLPFNSLVP